MNDAKELYGCWGAKLSLTNAYNLKANGNVERGHELIVKTLVRACNEQVIEPPTLCAMGQLN